MPIPDYLCPEEPSIKILHVIPSVAERYGGPSYAIYQMCVNLQHYNVQPVIVTTNADGEGVLPVPLDKLVSYQGVPTIFFQRDWSEAFKYSRQLANWLTRHVSDFDLVHIHAVFSHACLSAARVCHQFGIPYIVRTIGNLDPWSLGQKRLRKKILWHLSVKQMLRRAAAIHYTTRDEQQLAESALGLSRGEVIPLGVDESFLQPARSHNPFLVRYPKLRGIPYIITLCRLHPKKNLEALINAFQHLAVLPKFAAWQLVIAGEGDTTYLNQLQRLTECPSMATRIFFPGWLQGEEKHGALQAAQLFVLPSYQENFGLSVIEAMACSVPVILSESVNLAKEIAESKAGWVVSLEGEALRQTLEETLHDQQERKLRGAAGRVLVEQEFRWSAIAERLVNLYVKIHTCHLPQ